MSSNKPKGLEESILAYAGVCHEHIRNIAESGAKDGGVDRRHGLVLDRHLEFMYHSSTEEAIMEGADVYLSIAKKGGQFQVGEDYKLPYPIDNPQTLVGVLTFLESSTNLGKSTNSRTSQ